jgi:hypothetical protein
MHFRQSLNCASLGADTMGADRGCNELPVLVDLALACGPHDIRAQDLMPMLVVRTRSEFNRDARLDGGTRGSDLELSQSGWLPLQLRDFRAEDHRFVRNLDVGFDQAGIGLEVERLVAAASDLSCVGEELLIHAVGNRTSDDVGVEQPEERGRGEESVPYRLGCPLLIRRGPCLDQLVRPDPISDLVSLPEPVDVEFDQRARRAGVHQPQIDVLEYVVPAQKREVLVITPD